MSRDPEGNPKLSQPSLRIAIPDMSSIIRGIAQGTIQWKVDSNFNTEVPIHVPHVDMSKFDLGKFYTDQSITDQVKALKLERREWLEKFPELNNDITTALS